MVRAINTDAWSRHWRRNAIDVANEKILVTRLLGTHQERDLTEPPNCDGFGRIRHFRRNTTQGWPSNPLPIDPARKFFGALYPDTIRAQVFQNAVCNWRCWYCYVPFELLSANPKYSAWLSAKDLIDLYLKESNRPRIIDLSGGQPDLTPEWIPWIIREIQTRDLEDEIYIWSDDNLSNDYFRRFLSETDIDLICGARNYGRVCCFKGFDEESFAFNTLADSGLFDRQFALMRQFVDLEMDVYAYVTLTSPTARRITENIRVFFDRLQDVHENLPLRTVPLEIREFSPVIPRMSQKHRNALEFQEIAIGAWNQELDTRFSQDQQLLPVTDVSLAS